MHRIEDATEVADQAVRDWPAHPNANFYAAKLLRRAGKTEEAIAAFEQLTQRTDIASEVKANAWYEIAKQHDQDGEYAEAYHALRHAKDAYKNEAEKDWWIAHKIAENNERMLSTITADHFRRWADKQSELAPLPSRLTWLIGHPRSGTTLLEQVFDNTDGNSEG